MPFKITLINPATKAAESRTVLETLGIDPNLLKENMQYTPGSTLSVTQKMEQYTVKDPEKKKSVDLYQFIAAHVTKAEANFYTDAINKITDEMAPAFKKVEDEIEQEKKQEDNNNRNIIKAYETLESKESSESEKIEARNLLKKIHISQAQWRFKHMIYNQPNINELRHSEFYTSKILNSYEWLDSKTVAASHKDDANKFLSTMLEESYKEAIDAVKKKNEIENIRKKESLGTLTKDQAKEAIKKLEDSLYSAINTYKEKLTHPQTQILAERIRNYKNNHPVCFNNNNQQVIILAAAYELSESIGDKMPRKIFNSSKIPSQSQDLTKIFSTEQAKPIYTFIMGQQAVDAQDKINFLINNILGKEKTKAEANKTFINSLEKKEIFAILAQKQEVAFDVAVNIVQMVKDNKILGIGREGELYLSKKIDEFQKQFSTAKTAYEESKDAISLKSNPKEKLEACKIALDKLAKLEKLVNEYREVEKKIKNLAGKEDLTKIIGLEAQEGGILALSPKKLQEERKSIEFSIKINEKVLKDAKVARNSAQVLPINVKPSSHKETRYSEPTPSQAPTLSTHKPDPEQGLPAATVQKKVPPPPPPKKPAVQPIAADPIVTTTHSAAPKIKKPLPPLPPPKMPRATPPLPTPLTGPALTELEKEFGTSEPQRRESSAPPVPERRFSSEQLQSIRKSLDEGRKTVNVATKEGEKSFIPSRGHKRQDKIVTWDKTKPLDIEATAPEPNSPKEPRPRGRSGGG